MEFWQLVLAILGVVGPVIGVVWSIIAFFKGRQRLLLTYEVETDTDLVSIRRDQGENIEVRLDGQVVEQVRIHGIKFKNAGTVPISFDGTINKKSFDKPFGVRFPRGSVIRAGIEQISPGIIPDRDKIKDHVLLDADKQRVTFTDITLNPEEWIKLKALTNGKVKHTVEGHLTGALGGAGIKEFAPSQPRSPRWALIPIGLVLGIFIAFTFNPIATFVSGNCTFGTLNITGSSAFAEDIAKYAQQYQTSCFVANISVHASSSQLGLDEIKRGEYQIGNSDFSAPLPLYSDLQDHPVAAIVFVLVANKSVNITSLTRSQLLNIFTGKTTDWKDITGGQSQPITIINRTADSGTYTALKDSVLSRVDPLNAPKSIPVSRSDQVVPTVADTPGALGYVEEGIAIQPSNVSKVTMLGIDGMSPAPGLVASNAYPFWSIEHMYTKGKSVGLTESFIRYVQNHLETTDSLVKLDAISKDALRMKGYSE